MVILMLLYGYYDVTLWIWVNFGITFVYFLLALFQYFPWLPSQLSSTSVLVCLSSRKDQIWQILVCIFRHLLKIILSLNFTPINNYGWDKMLQVHPVRNRLLNISQKSDFCLNLCLLGNAPVFNKKILKFVMLFLFMYC